MKRIFSFFLVIFFVSSVFAQTQTPKNLMWGDSLRQYLEYVPASYNSNTPAPVLFCLHGLGGDMTSTANNTGFRNIADQHGWIIITPQALTASVPLVGSVGTAWAAGVSATLPILGNVELNENVDDVGFLMAILDDLIANYNIDAQNVFATGFSMGGFMSNRLGIEKGDRIRAIASVSGTVGNVISSQTPVAHISAMHIHGTADSTITYANADFAMSGMSYCVGLGAEATVNFWKDFNHCDATPIVTNYENSVSDGLTFEKYQYENGDNNTKTAFIKVIGGEHTWYYTPANDIDYATEIYNFFASCMTTGIHESNADTFAVYPNPAQDNVNITGENIAQIQLINAIGQVVMTIQQPTCQNVVSVSNCPEGIYLIRTTFTNGTIHCQRLIVNK
ncbi:MAG: T9SS type A sorting domain-containing protein [Bacteroidales bacterium]|jgi:polyhydroxybutyrate depolymerase|nr:T9SS type A sorting domain-containing protein [Bacteroidales bacterium]